MAGKYAIITENDVSDWDDKTGELYHYPKRYLKYLEPGTKVIYYKGRIQDKKYADNRLSNNPHYFGLAMMGHNFADTQSKKNDYYSEVIQFELFEKAIPFKINDEYLEEIPESKKSNYWRDGVQEISEMEYEKILNHSQFRTDPLENVSPPVLKEGEYIKVQEFDRLFNAFKKYVEKESKEPFNSFSNSYLHEEEGYKQTLRNEAIQKLKYSSWGTPGSGKIAKQVIQTIELEENNLVEWRAKRGDKARNHYPILQALEKGINLAEIEEVLLFHFQSKSSDAKNFERMVNLFGKKYSLIAYLFYLKNDRIFLPISTTNFDKAFRLLGSTFTTSLKASWFNYQGFLSIIEDTKLLIESKLNSEIQLIDAHSFLWILSRTDEITDTIQEENKQRYQNSFNIINTQPINTKTSQVKKLNNKVPNEQSPDFERINRQKRINGRKAEELVLEYERKQLIKAGKLELAKKVEDYSKRLGVGYDILSFKENGEEKHIEVKYSKANSFIITRNELNVSANDPNYVIYIVNVDESTYQHQIKILNHPDLTDNSKFRLEPKEYFVSFEEEE